MYAKPEQNHLLYEDLEKTESTRLESSPAQPRGSCRTIIFLYTALALSICANMLTLKVYSTAVTDRGVRNSVSSHSNSATGETRYAKLTFDVQTEFQYRNIYTDHNESIARAAWDAINYDRGSVALTQDEIRILDLPEAQEFPWDTEKRMYFLNAHHSLHCLKTIYKTLFELRDQETLSYPFGHALHCMDALRQDIICFADDTPRFTVADEPGATGETQSRMCRSWSKLEDWSLDHNSCWRDINPTEHIDTLLRYRYCPEGSPYNARIKALYGEFDKGPGASATT